MGTNKGQILRKNFLPSKILQIFFILIDYFWGNAQFTDFWCEGLGSFLKRTFGGPGKPEVNRWSNISLILLSDSTSPDHLISFI